MGNNKNPEFTDQEILTIYLFCVYEQQRFKVKEIYNFTKNYLQDWFPKLKSYVAFNTNYAYKIVQFVSKRIYSKLHVF